MELHDFLNRFLQALQAAFGKRVWFVGLQGSRARGEAVAGSDMDLVVILDVLRSEDIAAYDQLLHAFEERSMLCGFLAGKAELFAWDTAELFTFCRDTQPLFGSLDTVLALTGRKDAVRAVKSGLCAVYHGTVHNLLYEKSEDVLKALYKSAVFTVQVICYLETGHYVHRHADLLPVLSAPEQRIVQTALQLRAGAPVDFLNMSRTLFLWAQSRLNAS